MIVALVREMLDLGAITAGYRGVLGQPPFDPRLMIALLLHGYVSGIYSSRRIAKAAVERVDFMMMWRATHRTSAPSRSSVAVIYRR